MTSKSKSKSKSRQKTGGSGSKSANDSKSAKGSDYPNIIEEPIRVVGDPTRDKAKAGKSRKRTTKRSDGTVAKKSGRQRRS